MEMDELTMIRRNTNTAHATASAAHAHRARSEEAIAVQTYNTATWMTAAIMHDLCNNAFILMMPDFRHKFPSKNVASHHWEILTQAA